MYKIYHLVQLGEGELEEMQEKITKYKSMEFCEASANVRYILTSAIQQGISISSTDISLLFVKKIFLVNILALLFFSVLQKEKRLKEQNMRLLKSCFHTISSYNTYLNERSKRRHFHYLHANNWVSCSRISTQRKCRRFMSEDAACTSLGSLIYNSQHLLVQRRDPAQEKTLERVADLGLHILYG